MDYLPRLIRAFDRGLIDKGTLTIATIAHDDDCPIQSDDDKIAGKSCTCDPWVFIDTDQGRVFVLEDGTLTNRAPE